MRSVFAGDLSGQARRCRPDSAIGLIRSLSARGRDSSQSCRRGLRSETGTAFPQPKPEGRSMLTQQADYVIGVDTHAAMHAFCLVEAASGALLSETQLPADRRGYRQALALARRSAPGRRLWAIEGAGSYGAGLARFLGARGEQGVEVE